MTISRRDAWILLLSWLGAIAVSAAADRPVAQWVQARRPLDKATPSGVARSGNHPIGLTRIVRLPGNYLFVVVAGVGLVVFHRRHWGAAVPVFLSGPLVGMTYVVMKWVVGRRRPVIELAPFTFHPFIDGIGGLVRSVSGLAFPSGDATMAFAAAACMAAALPRWAVLFFAWAALVALERVLENAHYVSDVVAGAGLGILCATAVLWISRRILGRPPGESIDVSPDRLAPDARTCATET
jgi:membrane-associated phospholipid phosphatase